MSETTCLLGVEGFQYPDLFDANRLKSLFEVFDQKLAADNPELHSRWTAYCQAPESNASAVEVSALLVGISGHVSRFLIQLFRIENEAAGLAAATADQDPIFRFKVDFVRRRVLPALKKIEVPSEPGEVEALEAAVQRLRKSEDAGVDLELATARAAVRLMAAQATEQLSLLATWCALHLHDPDYRHWVSFRFPEPIDHFDLVRVQRPRVDLQEAMIGPDLSLRRRDGFVLTDGRMSTREVLSEVHYCILCHERDKDSCTKGIRTADGAVAKNPLDIPLEGCPLDEKISEMHYMRKRGDVIAALALVMITNPMCPGTGHRICNDCMKACIYQKQDPVNIPEIETAVLTDTLKLPWGVEIYGLLTRWNPLNIRRPYAQPYNGKNILVVGMGPAGYTLAHYLANEGFGIAGIDGLKIEPLPRDLTGTADIPPRPIRDWQEIYRALDERILEGFGGVSEYGITVRWDKNFLTLLHLTLARRNTIRIYGGVRFGGTLTIEDAWSWGFDHIAIAAGAGRPTIIDMKNNLASGVRKASDFLMALQLTGAFKRNALPNLQVRLPAIVIGGGLTAIDTATELAAYYPLQVEKVLQRHEKLVETLGPAAAAAPYNQEEGEILKEYLEHGAAVRAERERAAAANEKPDFVKLVRSWGGVSLAYRKRMLDSPAYRLNHEEVKKALEEGIFFIENVNPEEIVLDEFNQVRAVRFAAPGRHVELAARSVMVAAGTSPNITYEKEHAGSFAMDSQKKFFAAHRVQRQANGTLKLEPARDGVFTSYHNQGRCISFYGDNHPRYAGNVVKAMASARDGYSQVTALFADDISAINPATQSERDQKWQKLSAFLDEELIATVSEVRRLTPTIVEVIVQAPSAARKFEPGQFYRLQNFEANAKIVDGTRLLMEGIALTGAWVDKEKGLLSMIALEMGVSSRLVMHLKPGEQVVVMGPTGTPSEIGKTENVLLLGGGLGNAVLFSIARKMKEQGNRVIYFAGYKKGEDLFKQDEVEMGTDQVIWSTDIGAAITPRRPQDRHFRGNIVQSVLAYGRGEMGAPLVPLTDIHRIIAIGSDRMMAAVRDARHGVLQPLLNPNHTAIASINSPMQCMMKEVCAQCLQKHVDPETGKETVVFSCLNQDQLMDHVDFKHLNTRLHQNTVQEKLSNLWLNHLLTESSSRPAK